MVALQCQSSLDGAVIQIEAGHRLEISPSRKLQYRFAQLDDYSGQLRKNFPHRSISLSLRARASHSAVPGTWGFGLWNDPFGFSFGFGGNPLRLPAPPNAIWFFHGSPENYLSFRNDKPARGMLAQVFRAPSFNNRLIAAGIALPIFPRLARKFLSRVIEEDAIQLDLDVTQWHAYRFEWRVDQSIFWVDDSSVLKTKVSPRPPLGLVLWIDNQFAAFSPEGKIKFGVLETFESAWVEMKDLVVRT